MDRRVVVTGIGVMCAVGNNAEDSWQALLAGKSGIERITSFDASAFACQIGAEVKGFDPLEEIKRATAERWVAAVNADGTYGQWCYAVARKMTEIPAIVEAACMP